jgi:hypothetical protein
MGPQTQTTALQGYQRPVDLIRWLMRAGLISGLVLALQMVLAQLEIIEGMPWWRIQRRL